MLFKGKQQITLIDSREDLESLRRDSCFAKDVGVSGQLEILALDQLVTAVSGEMLMAGALEEEAAGGAETGAVGATGEG